jgi:hypothetical protein
MGYIVGQDRGQITIFPETINAYLNGAKAFDREEENYITDMNPDMSD